MYDSAVMLMSGGIESAVVAAMLSINVEGNYHYTNIRRALTVNYGQRAWDQEYLSAVYLCSKYGIFLEVVEMQLPFLQSHPLVSEGLVAVYWPTGMSKGHIVEYRNLIFLSIAASYAASMAKQGDIVGLYTGFDYDPKARGAIADKSPFFQVAAQKTLDTAREGAEIRLVSPLNEFPVGKTANIKRALDYGVDLGKTWSCYNDGPLQCGGCGSCIVRYRAFEELVLVDPAGMMPIEDCEEAIQQVRRLEGIR